MSGVHLDMTGEHTGKECLCPAGSCIGHYPYGSVCRALNKAYFDLYGEYIAEPPASQRGVAPEPAKAADIVERLRDGNMTVSGEAWQINNLLRLHREAADQIEQLRAVLADLLSATNPLAETPADMHKRRKRAAALLSRA